MRFEIARKSLRDRRRGLLGWSLGLALLIAVMCAYWPSVRDSPDLQSFVRDLPEGVRAFVGDVDYGTAAGYLNGELFSFMVPLLLLVVAIGMGARAIAGEEERGTADLLFSAPVTRIRVVLEKVAAGLVVLAGLGVVLFAALALGAAVVDMDIAAGRLAAISLATVLLALPFGALALAVGCLTGERGTAIAVASVAAVAAFMLETLGTVVDSLSGWRDLSPWNWYASDRVLLSGIDVGDAALLAGSALVLLGAGIAALRRRDLAV